MLILFLIVFVDLIGFGMIIPLLPFYGEHLDATPAQVGLLMAVYSMAQFLTAPLWGRLSDRIGRRPVLIISLAGIGLSYLWLAFADSLWILFAARATAGAMAGNIGVAFAYAADITTPETRARGMGLLGAAFSLGFIFGPAIGGVLAGPDPAAADYRTPALAAAALSLAALILTVLRLRESLSPEIRARTAALSRRKRRSRMKDMLFQPTVAWLLVLVFLANTVFAGLETTFAMWSRRQFGWGPEQNGWLFAFIGVLAAAVQGGLIGRLTSQFGETRLVMAGSLLLAIGIGAIPMAQSVAALLPAMMVAAVGFALTQPALSALISLQVGAESQGAAMGISRSASTLARIVGPILGGLLFFWLGRHAPYLASAAVMAVVTALAFGLHARLQRAKAKSSD